MYQTFTSVHDSLLKTDSYRWAVGSKGRVCFNARCQSGPQKAVSPYAAISCVKEACCCQIHMLESPGWRSYQSWLPAPHLTVIHLWMAL